MRWWMRMLLAGIVGGLLVAGGLGAALWVRVLQAPPERYARERIEAIIAQESPVYYRDGRTPVGVFFAREHRVYVPYERLPRAWIHAIVATEDKRFFRHHGVDPLGIARAMLANLRAGRVVAGGSTLTQQTAKNLYYRPDRSLRSKLQELVDAFALERRYSKDEILEFYANQFHVSANGRGIGIAARYFFDKRVEELDTLECAFIAGMVKAPGRYDPFLGRSPERREEARRKALARTRVVLDRMLAEGYLSPEEHARLRARELVFRHGRFRYPTSVLLDEVQRRLEEPPFPEVLAAAGIDNPSTAGIRITTTLDPAAQAGAAWALRHHLTEIGGSLEGWTATDLLVDPERVRPVRQVREGGVFAARVVAFEEEGIRLDVGGHPCRVDGEGVERLERLLAQARAASRWADPTPADREALRAALRPGAAVEVAVRPGGGGALCDVEARPELQGAIVVLEGGRVRALVGGRDNRDFNRATTAVRQFGSTWKVPVFQAALELGWLPTDELDNRPVPHPFEGSAYYPRPDHRSEPFVSLAWAGVRSENLATTWLLAHLLDRLAPEQVVEVARALDLGPRPGESRAATIARIRDRYGVIATPERLAHGLVLAAARRLARSPDLGRVESWNLRSLVSAPWLDEERRRLDRLGRSERARRRRALELDAGWLQARRAACRERGEALAARVEAIRATPLQRLVDLGGAFVLGDSLRPQEVLRPPSLDPDAFPDLSWGELDGRLAVACGPAPEGFVPIGPGFARRPGAPGAARDPWVAGRLRVSTLRRLEEAAEALRAEMEGVDPYSAEALALHPDFRTYVALRYVADLVRRQGVQRDLPPVLSLPLGAVEISLEELAALYEGMVTGHRPRFRGLGFSRSDTPGILAVREVGELPGPTVLIEEIRDARGNLVYRARRDDAAGTGDPVRAAVLSDILANVVRFGTGRSAARALPGWPMGGKTGTTNGFRNSAFAGYVRALDREEPFIVAATVGYDDNRAMRRGRIRLQGSSGALPAWILTVEELRRAGLLGGGEPPAAPPDPPGTRRVRVQAGTGLPAAPAPDPVDPVGERTVLVRDPGTGPVRWFAPRGGPGSPLSGDGRLP